MVLAVGRSLPIKNLALTIAAWRALPAPRPQLVLFGSEPELADEPGIRYVVDPSDADVDRLLREATVFVATSRHEGFCLPILEAMAAGAAVVCTDADGNRDFCSDGVNCLIAEPTTASVRDAIARVVGDPELRARLGEAGRTTAAGYDWATRINALERFFYTVARAETPRGPRRPAEQSD